MSDERVSLSYGSWQSPITTELIVSESISLGDMAIDGENIYWLEMRPSEDGRYVIVKRTPDGSQSDVNPAPFNARTRVHEYGGGSYIIHDGMTFFSNYTDQRVYRIDPDGLNPTAITPDGIDHRYADYTLDIYNENLITVREDHTDPGEASNTLVSININGIGDVRILISGADFYSSPALSPDGSLLAWIQWNHPNMPWDSTELWIAEVRSDGSLISPKKVKGREGESICQPVWSPDGVLHFVSDETGWWNIYRQEKGKPVNLTPIKAEFTQAQWGLGARYYGFPSSDRIICAMNENGIWSLAEIFVQDKQLEKIPTIFTEISRSGLKVSKEALVFGAGSSKLPYSVYLRGLDGSTAELRKSDGRRIAAEYISQPEPIKFPTENGLTAHAFFYPPKNPQYCSEAEELPPLLVISHGGPTGATTTTLNLTTQFWTSRGFGVLDVNYGGSTGYGTDYRRRLNGRWGIVDIEDCVNGAKFLVSRGDVDGNRLAIRGGSAGGYTTLAALTFTDVFKAGASYYGVSDLEALALETHKFESRYMDSMVGPYPEMKNIYEDRSPIFHTDLLSCPVILFQGLEDKIVLPNQAEMMVDALNSNGIPVAYIAFEGEQHGFRKSENIQKTLDAELYFYSRIFGFDVEDIEEPVFISNLD